MAVVRARGLFARRVRMWQYYRKFFNVVDHLSYHEWLVVLLGVVLWGLFCMRGFGSRTNY